MKQQEVIKLNIDELKEQLVEMKKKQNELKFAHSVSPLENPLQLKQIRRSIARVLTEIKNRDSK